jgi:nitronate monooxygenase
MAIRTWLTETVGIRYPVIQGAFHGFGNSKLAAAVSAAGGLGVITAHNFPTAEALRADIRAARALTDRPIGVNFSILPPSETYTTRIRFASENATSAEGYAERLEATLDEGIRVIFTSAYDGSPLGRRAKERGAVWIHKAATLRHMLGAARKGADAVVAFGLEGSGFKSPQQNTFLINLTTLRRNTSVPFMPAGGVGDGRGLAAALALGACGVYLGTAFMATQECPVTDRRKRAIVEQDVTDPAYHVKALNPNAHTALHSMASGAIDSIPTVEDFLRRFMSEAEEAIQALGDLVRRDDVPAHRVG